ncbi:MATE family efflux transporter [Simiduia aestuariiviva]|uniref:Putative MATE family efflux protein n=1 Tax=Simiduia aestuariiviva TaxID=1510459 RepID=A0A839USQ2_9GAMM|nr:MATE family efflux transporter [Simiduia aestuariiviva]MBB3169469.1 putative MATE family efflux protein [Simiduia aestuariiviva]
MNASQAPRLTEGPVGAHLRDMAMPMVWGLLATMSFNAVDTLFVAQLGHEPLAAMSFTFPVVMVLTSIAIGLGAGTSSAVARAIGADNHHLAQRMATDAMTLTTIISVVMCGIGLATINPLFTLLGAEPELLPLIHDYMWIWYFSAPCLMVPMVGLASLRAMGLARIQGTLMMAAALLNLILDPLLIFGLFGLPRLELEGAALATLITRALSLVAVIYILHKQLRMLVNPFASLHEVWVSWRAILHVGVPAMVNNIIIPLASGVVVYLVATYGTVAVAGLGIAMRIEPIALIVFYALSGVVGPFCGQNLGAEKYQRLDETLRVMTKFCMLFGVALAAVLWATGELLIRLFADTDAVVDVARSYLLIVPISYGAYGLVMSVNAAFNGIGQPMPGVAISFLRVIGLYLPLAWLLQWQWGLTGLFFATGLCNLLVGFVAWLWLRHRFSQLA